jgi:ABC-type nitrate/sulfonate/bicarbonate transport system substrate-binding protein
MGKTENVADEEHGVMTGKLSRRTFLIASGAASLGLGAGARTSRGQALETLNIGLSPFINQATIFMANDLGLFSKVGLEIRMKVFMDGALVVAPWFRASSTSAS